MRLEGNGPGGVGSLGKGLKKLEKLRLEIGKLGWIGRVGGGEVGEKPKENMIFGIRCWWNTWGKCTSGCWKLGGTWSLAGQTGEVEVDEIGIWGRGDEQSEEKGLVWSWKLGEAWREWTRWCWKFGEGPEEIGEVEVGNWEAWVNWQSGRWRSWGEASKNQDTRFQGEWLTCRSKNDDFP